MKEITDFSNQQIKSWAVQNRKLYRAGTLSPRKQRLLERIPFWVWDINVSFADREWISMETLSSIAKTHGFKNREEYKQWQSKNKTIDGKFIPSAPNHLYKNQGWKGWAHFLGSKYRRGAFLPYQDAKALVQSLKINSRQEYLQAYKDGKLPNVPSCPNECYKEDGFEGWYVYLGKGAGKRKHWRSYDAAKQYAHSLNLTDVSMWKELARSGNLPSDIPAAPETFYVEFSNWFDWLGASSAKRKYVEFLSFEDARTLVHTLGLHQTKTYKQYIKNHTNIPVPSRPDEVYAADWRGWHDFLGAKSRPDVNHNFLTFTEAREFVRSLKLFTTTAWRKYIMTAAHPRNIPTNPNLYYKEWQGMRDWLGIKHSPCRV